MTKFVSPCVRHSLRFALLAGFALGLSACSTSFDRFSDYPDVNTSSLPDNESSDNQVQSRPIERASIEPNKPSWQNGYQRQNGYQQNSYQQNNNQQGYQNRSAMREGGTIVVQPGQTLYSIARANNISPNELASMNQLPPPYALSPGMRLRVPNPDATAQAHQPQRVQAANAPVPSRDFGQSGTHTVRSGETLFAVGRTYNMNPYTIAEYNQLSKPYALSAGQRLRIPGQASAQNAMQAPQAQQAQQNTLQLPAQQQAAAQQEVVQPPVQQQAPRQQQAAVEEQAASTFRWPVKGRIISSYGQKPNGLRNEGINISVPEGTSIRASESGVVAYAGNELKGYGNLVLIRHEGGWVTAYAHAKDILVKRGDTVKRGDVIARAGQTGSVTSPQLHFELRKGATAVDPMRHMGSDQAMN
ncbi:MAG: peptidoglycan DD-metalloendopeptidase family protein [Parvibaculaceae bacterium]